MQIQSNTVKKVKIRIGIQIKNKELKCWLEIQTQILKPLSLGLMVEKRRTPHNESPQPGEHP